MIIVKVDDEVSIPLLVKVRLVSVETYGIDNVPLLVKTELVIDVASVKNIVPLLVKVRVPGVMSGIVINPLFVIEELEVKLVSAVTTFIVAPDGTT